MNNAIAKMRMTDPEIHSFLRIDFMACTTVTTKGASILRRNPKAVAIETRPKKKKHVIAPIAINRPDVAVALKPSRSRRFSQITRAISRRGDNTPAQAIVRYSGSFLYISNGFGSNTITGRDGLSMSSRISPDRGDVLDIAFLYDAAAVDSIGGIPKVLYDIECGMVGKI